MAKRYLQADSEPDVVAVLKEMAMNCLCLHGSHLDHVKTFFDDLVQGLASRSPETRIQYLDQMFATFNPDW